MSGSKYKCENDNCICDVVRKIIAAQDEVASRRQCASGCESSIKQLLSSSPSSRDGNTTIPFILYTKDGSKPFIASGVYKAPIEGYNNETFFDCLETPVVRAKKLVKGSKCCVILELLRSVNANGFPVADSGEKLCDFFCDKTPHKTVNFRETGICITVDLDCFCGITCLDAITPLPPYHKNCRY